MLVIDSAGVLKEKKIQSKINKVANSELSNTTSGKRPEETESTAINDTSSTYLRKRISYEKDVYLKKRLRAAKDSNKELKDATRQLKESIAIRDTTTEGEKIPFTKETSAKKKQSPARKMLTPAKKKPTTAKNKQSEKRRESPRRVSSRSPPKRYRPAT
jgi:hypothetical protein